MIYAPFCALKNGHPLLSSYSGEHSYKLLKSTFFYLNLDAIPRSKNIPFNRLNKRLTYLKQLVI